MTANLVLAFGTKAPCLGRMVHGVMPGYCYSDFQMLFVARRLGEHIFPYVHGLYTTGPSGSVFIGHGELEYPVLTGLLVWLAALPVHTATGFFLTNAAVLSPFGLASAWLLARMSGRKALFFAASPAVALYGFINWDLVPVALAVLGVYLWWRQRPYWAATCFAVGGCAKLWPAFFLVPLVAELVWQRDNGRAVRVCGIAAGFVAATNLPFAIINFRGWFAPFAYQAALPISYGTSLWDWDGHALGVGAGNVASSLVVLVGFAVLAVMGWRRADRDGVFPLVQTGAAMVFWYVLTAKDNSPEYVLWMVTFFALVRLKPQLWAQLGLLSLALSVDFISAASWVPAAQFVVACWQGAFLIIAVREVMRAVTVFEPVPTEVVVGARAFGGWRVEAV
jgi:hypothetical protein